MSTIAEKLTAIASAKEAIKSAIEGKGVEVANAPLSEYPAKIAEIKAGGGWTGHADAEGLKAIGWNDDDIAYYQEYGVNWNEEDDEYHKVTDDNKALYGVLTLNNIQTYANRIVYLPKLNTAGVANLAYKFQNCYSLVAIPLLDTSSATNMGSMFNNCYSLVTIPQLDTAKVTSMNGMFQGCYSLVTIPPLDTAKVTSLANMFNRCHSLVAIPPLDTSSVTTMSGICNRCYSLVAIPPFDTAKVTSWGSIFYECHSLVAIPPLDVAKSTGYYTMCLNCYSLTYVKLKGIVESVDISSSAIITHESLMYIITNAKDLTGGTTQTLTLGSTNLAKLTDEEKAIIIAKNWTLA